MYHYTNKEYNSPDGFLCDFEIIRNNSIFYKEHIHYGKLQLFYSEKIDKKLSRYYILKKELMDIL